MSYLFKFLVFGATAYLSVLAFLYVMQRSMIYHPDSNRPEPAAWKVPDMKVVTLATDDGLSLLAWWKPPRDGKPVIVLFHGNGGHIGYRGFKVRGFLDHGYGVLLVSWRGYGGNAGNPTEPGLYADGHAALRYLENQGIRNEQIVLYGESLGSGTAVELASQGKGGILVLEAPFTSLADAAKGRYPIFPVRLLMKDNFDSLSKIDRVKMPLLIIHGDKDSILPVSMGRELLAKANEPKQGVFVPDAGHNNLFDFGGSGIVLAFLEKTLSTMPKILNNN